MRLGYPDAMIAVIQTLGALTAAAVLAVSLVLFDWRGPAVLFLAVLVFLPCIERVDRDNRLWALRQLRSKGHTRLTGGPDGPR